MSERPGRSAAKSPQLPVLGMVSVELFCTVLLTALGLLSGREEAQAIAMGALTCVLPNAYIARRFNRALASGSGISGLVIGELGKFLLTASLFVVVFVTHKDLNYLLFFSAFAVMQLFHWVVLYYIKIKAGEH